MIKLQLHYRGTSKQFTRIRSDFLPSSTHLSLLSGKGWVEWNGLAKGNVLVVRLEEPFMGSPQVATTTGWLTDWICVGWLRRMEGGLIRWAGGAPRRRGPKPNGLIGLGPPLGLNGNLSLGDNPDLFCSDYKKIKHVNFWSIFLLCGKWYVKAKCIWILQEFIFCVCVFQKFRFTNFVEQQNRVEF